MSNTVELATIRLKPGIGEAELVAASDIFQHYLRGIDGFLRRELLHLGSGEYADLVHWRSAADAEAMMEKAASSPECLAYFSMMDMENMDPSDGVRHFKSLATYGRE